MISALGAEKLSLVEIESFLQASESVRFAGCGRTEIYGRVGRLFCRHACRLQKLRANGLLRAYIARMTGLSRGQTTRLVGGYVATGGCSRSRRRGNERCAGYRTKRPCSQEEIAAVIVV